jgi:hypothetical protein
MSTTAWGMLPLQVNFSLTRQSATTHNRTDDLARPGCAPIIIVHISLPEQQDSHPSTSLEEAQRARTHFFPP